MSDVSLIGKQIDEYRLEAMLGEGGMASVYRALDVRLNRYVAVKVIRTNLRADSVYTMRFEREAQAIAQLDHPNIITLYRFGEKDGLLYMVMQFIDGADLAAVIESFRRDGDYIDFKEVIRVAYEIGAGLDYAHTQGVIHRDIKPHNIMVNHDGRILVTDFGLALMTEIGTHGEIFGSPHYIAPEQAISSAGAVPASDIYALGVVLYEMLTGTLPFDASLPLDVAMMHMSDPVPSPRERRPELSEAVEKVLFKALEKEPSERYATARELARALEAALQEKSGTNRATITSKVELERNANPLPPIAPAVSLTTQRHQASVTQQVAQGVVTQPSSKTKRSQWSIYAVGGVAASLLLVLLLILLLSSNDSDTPQPTADLGAVAESIEPTIVEITAETVQVTETTSLAETPNTTTGIVASQEFTAVSSSVIPTSIPVQEIPTTSVPSPTQSIISGGMFTVLLSNGRGLTTGQQVTNGEFEVEGYCAILNSSYGVEEDGLHWYCTQNGVRVKTLLVDDFDEICRRTYNEPNALAMQLPGSQPAAYRWRCYVNVVQPTPQSNTDNMAQVQSSSDEPVTTDVAPTMYSIRIRWQGEDSLFITNISNNLEFPLSPLSLRGNGQINGDEWGVGELASNECVAVWKDTGNPRSAETTCTLVGQHVQRDGPSRFWKSSFTVIYGGLEVATCETSPCTVDIQR